MPSLTYNSVQEFWDFFQITSDQVSESVAKECLEFAFSFIFIQISDLSDVPYPDNDEVKDNAVVICLKMAEKMFALGHFMRTTVYYERNKKPDLNILSIGGMSRGADTPSPIESVDNLWKRGMTMLEEARTLIRQIKPKPYPPLLLSPSATYWTLITEV